MMGGVSPETCWASYKYGIIKFWYIAASCWIFLYELDKPLNLFNPLSSIHLAVCLTTGPKSLPKRALHIVRSRASSFKWEYPLLSLRSSNSFVRLLPCLLVTSNPPCIFPSITRCRRQFLRKMWPIQFAFRLRVSCRIFLCSLTLSNTIQWFNKLSQFRLLYSCVLWLPYLYILSNTSSFLTWSVQLIFSILFQHHISKLSRCLWSTARSVQVSAPYKAMLQINPLKPELNPICYLLALLGVHHFVHVSSIRVKLLTFRLLMSYIYGAPILDVSRSHTTQHSR